jgi:hypothetical protein
MHHQEAKEVRIWKTVKRHNSPVELKLRRTSRHKRMRKMEQPSRVGVLLSSLLFSSLLFLFLCNREICEELLLQLLQGTRQQKEGEDDPSSKIMNWRLWPSRIRKLFFMGIFHPRRDWIGVINFATVI